MPTGRDNDVIPVRRTTKEALAAVKRPGESYDRLVRALLDATPPEVLRDRVDTANAEARAFALARRRWRVEKDRGARRSPDKQVLIARAAERAWHSWLEGGAATRLGPRRYRWNPEFFEAPGEEVNVRVKRKGPGRGAS